MPRARRPAAMPACRRGRSFFATPRARSLQASEVCVGAARTSAPAWARQTRCAGRWRIASRRRRSRHRCSEQRHLSAPEQRRLLPLQPAAARQHSEQALNRRILAAAHHSRREHRDGGFALRRLQPRTQEQAQDLGFAALESAESGVHRDRIVRVERSSSDTTVYRARPAASPAATRPIDGGLPNLHRRVSSEQRHEPLVASARLDAPIHRSRNTNRREPVHRETGHPMLEQSRTGLQSHRARRASTTRGVGSRQFAASEANIVSFATTDRPSAEAARHFHGGQDRRAACPHAQSTAAAPSLAATRPGSAIISTSRAERRVRQNHFSYRAASCREPLDRIRPNRVGSSSLCLAM